MSAWRYIITTVLLSALLALSATQLTQAKSTSQQSQALQSIPKPCWQANPPVWCAKFQQGGQGGGQTGGTTPTAASCFATAFTPFKSTLIGLLVASGSVKCNVDPSILASLNPTISIYRDGILLNSSTSSGLSSVLASVPITTTATCDLSSQYKVVVSGTGTFRGSAIQIAAAENVASVGC
jgi:hypothetical protein